MRSHELARTADHQQMAAVYDKLIGSARVYFVPETAAAGDLASDCKAGKGGRRTSL